MAAGKKPVKEQPPLGSGAVEGFCIGLREAGTGNPHHLPYSDAYNPNSLRCRSSPTSFRIFSN